VGGGGGGGGKEKKTSPPPPPPPNSTLTDIRTQVNSNTVQKVELLSNYTCMTLTPLTFGTQQVDASYIVKSTLDIVYVRSMSVNSACVVAGARRVGPPL